MRAFGNLPLPPGEDCQAATPRAHPGFAISLIGGTAKVVHIYAGSPAERAGLKLGDEVVAIDDRSLTDQAEHCETMRWLIEDRPTNRAPALSVLRRNGQIVELTLAQQ